MAAVRNEIDWDAIQADYVAGMSQSQLSQKYGVPKGTISSRCIAGGWSAIQKAVSVKSQSRLTERVVTKIVTDRAAKMARIINAADRMTTILARVTDQLEEADKSNAKNLRGLSDLAKAISITADTAMRLYGIPTQSQEHAQHMAEERLLLERERMEMERRKAEAGSDGEDGVEVVWSMFEDDADEETDLGLTADSEVSADG